MFNFGCFNWFNFFGKQPKAEDCWWTPEGEAKRLKGFIK